MLLVLIEVLCDVLLVLIDDEVDEVDIDVLEEVELVLIEVDVD